MKRSGGTHMPYLISLITVAAALTACTPKGSVEQYTSRKVQFRQSLRSATAALR